jgi:hypothetical protein
MHLSKITIKQVYLINAHLTQPEIWRKNQIAVFKTIRLNTGEKTTDAIKTAFPSQKKKKKKKTSTNTHLVCSPVVNYSEAKLMFRRLQSIETR